MLYTDRIPFNGKGSSSLKTIHFHIYTVQYLLVNH